MPKKNFADSIRVKNPCTENWEEMAGNDRVRFCSHCAKDVNNISTMTRAQVERLVRRSGGRLCVRYRVDPKTNSPIFLPAFARHGVAAGVLGASLLTAGAYAQNEPASQPLVQIERTVQTGGASSKISGYVTDPNGAAIPYALVSVTNQETLVSLVQNASAEGFYEFKDLDAGKYKIRFEGGGFAFREIEDVYLSDASEIRRDGQLALLNVEASVDVPSNTSSDYQSVNVGVVVSTGDYVPSNPLVTAVLDGDLEDVKTRVLMGAKINKKDKSRDGMTPLHAAVETGNVEIAEYLLVNGAKVNIRDSEKRTPMMMMDDSTTLEMFQLLVRYGAKFTLLDKEKNNVLHHFAENADDAELTRQMVTYGAKVDAVNKEGKTPLMIAAEYDSPEIIKVLIESGADVNARDREGRTALDLVDKNVVKTRTLLETLGAVHGTR